MTQRTYILCKALLLDNPSTTEASTPRHHVGWLGTRLTNVYAGASWELAWDKNNHKSLQYISKTCCLLPEYLEESFKNPLYKSNESAEDGLKTTCGYCGINCKRKGEM